MKGLELIEGHSHESLIQALRDKKIKFEVEESPERHATRNFFRSSLLYLSRKDRTKIEKILGEPNHKMNMRNQGVESASYWGVYRITPEFTMPSLNGAVTFKNGNLVESTLLYYICD